MVARGGLHFAAGVALVAMGALPAWADELGGTLGLGYSGVTAFSEQTQLSLSQSLLQDMRVYAHGRPLPEVFGYDARAHYDNTRGWYRQRKTSVDNLGYDLGLHLLQAMPVSVDLYASRDNRDVSSVVLDDEFIGEAHTERVGGSVRVRAVGMPTFLLQVERTLSNYAGLGGAALGSELLNGNFSMGQNTQHLSYDLNGHVHRYRNRDTGTQYTVGRLSLAQSAKIDAKTNLRINGLLNSIREQEASGSVAARELQSSNVDVMLVSRHSEKWVGTYRYAVLESEREGFGDAGGQWGTQIETVDGALNYLLGSNWQLGGGVVLSRQSEETASGAVQALMAMSTVNSTVERTVAGYAARGAASAGFGYSVPNQGVAGANAMGTISAGLGTGAEQSWPVSTTLNGTAQRDYSSLGMKSMGMSWNVVASHPRWIPVRGQLQVSLASQVAESRASGKSRASTVNASADGRYRDVDASVRFQYRDAVSRRIVGEVVDPTVVLPSELNLVGTQVGFTAGYRPSPSWRLSATGNYTSMRSPGQEMEDVLGAELRVEFHMGKLNFIIWDRYIDGGRGGHIVQRENVVYCMVARSFGLTL